jgi:hypothetical protein
MSGLIPTQSLNDKGGQSWEEPAMRVGAAEAKNRHGRLCAQAKRAPVFVEWQAESTP